MNLFEQAVRQQLRFKLNGLITIEQLYASYHKNSSKSVLRQYASELKQELEGFKGFDVFDDASIKSKEQEQTELRLSIVKQLYTEIKEDEVAAKEKASVTERKQELLALKAQKQAEQRASLTLEEIEEQLKVL